MLVLLAVAEGDANAISVLGFPSLLYSPYPPTREREGKGNEKMGDDGTSQRGKRSSGSSVRRCLCGVPCVTFFHRGKILSSKSID